MSKELVEKITSKIRALEDHHDEGLEDWEYLIHHLHIDPDSDIETVHHCPMIDHLGNLYTVEHIIDDEGRVRHCLTGLWEDQEVYWSDEEAEADGETVPCANRQLEG